MRLGLLADIHEQVDLLKKALKACDQQGVDQILCLGDVFQKGEAIHETVALLAERNIAGVWGNHDFGLGSHPSAQVSPRREHYVGPVLDYLGTYQPSIEIEDCLISHVEPWRNLNNILGLWYLGGMPDDPAKAARTFNACPQRVFFTGHHHRWLIATPSQVLPWEGGGPILLQPPERYLVVVAAVCAGWCAIYDTDTGELIPMAL